MICRIITHAAFIEREAGSRLNFERVISIHRIHNHGDIQRGKVRSIRRMNCDADASAKRSIIQIGFHRVNREIRIGIIHGNKIYRFGLISVPIAYKHTKCMSSV